MLKSLFVDNFRGFCDFRIYPKGENSLLFVGNNGVGKSNIGSVLGILKNIGGGVSKVESLINTEKDFSLGRKYAPMYFKIEVLIDQKEFSYLFNFSRNAQEENVFVEIECLYIDNKLIFERSNENFSYTVEGKLINIKIDQDHVALAYLSSSYLSEDIYEKIQKLRKWLKNIMILCPVPFLIGGTAYAKNEMLSYSGAILPEFLFYILDKDPSIYHLIIENFRKFVPKTENFRFERKENRTYDLMFSFGDIQYSCDFNLKDLSEGEKISFLWSVILAIVQRPRDYGFFVFWDNPEMCMSLDEIQHFIRSLRKNFTGSDQIWMTSHNEETINCFSHDNTYLIKKEPNKFHPEIHLVSDLIESTESLTTKLRLGEI